MRSYYVEVSADLTVIESYNRFGIYLSSLSLNDLWNSTMSSLTIICVLFGRS